MGQRYDDVRPASEDPLGDPADQQQGVLPASQDPQGDPADQQYGQQGVLPASQDPLGDPADQLQQQYQQAQQHPAFGQAQQEYIQQMPPEQFQSAAQQSVQQMPPQQQQGLAGSLLGALQGRGVNLGQVGSMLGIGSPQPGQMGPQGLSQLLGWAQQNHPDAVHEVAAQHPGLIQGMGGGVLSGILGNLASRFMGGDQRRAA